jgi:hypothetical protein
VDKHSITRAQTSHSMKIHIPFVLIAIKDRTPSDPTEITGTELLVVADSWQTQTTRILHYKRSPAHRTRCLLWNETHIDRHAFACEKVVLERWMRISYLVKDGALETNFVGGLISEEPAMDYISQQTNWCGARHWPFIVDMKVIHRLTSHLGQCAGELVPR